MNYKVQTLPEFDRQYKRLKKKYPSFASDFLELLEKIKADPMSGTDLGKNCFKFRLGIRSKNKGKSGGARLISHVVVKDETVFFLTIYDKAEKDNLTDRELKELLAYLTL
jgi:mRNA-degrading endonuclease RelE of RelBE toxin-antitoxin system